MHINTRVSIVYGVYFPNIVEEIKAFGPPCVLELLDVVSNDFFCVQSLCAPT